MVRSHPQPQNDSTSTLLGPHHRGAGVRLAEILSAGLRFEASTFAPEARAALRDVRASGVNLVPLYGSDGLSNDAHNAFRFKRIYVSAERGIPFLTSADIINLRPRMERFLSRRRTPNLQELLVRRWDVLISCSGTIGNVALAGDTLAGMALSQDAIRWRCTRPEIAGYVAAVLRSRFGRLQLKRVTYGSVISHIEPEHLSLVSVPQLHPIRQTEIGLAMCEAADLRDRAAAHLNAANARVHEVLGMVPLAKLPRPETRIPFAAVRASQLAGRFDGSYHRPVVHRILERLDEFAGGTKPLGDRALTQEIRPITRFRKRTYVRSGGIPLLSSKQFFQVDPVDVKRLAKGAHTKDMGEIALEEDMILVTRSGTIGRVHIVPKYMEGWAGSEHAIRVIAAEGMNPGFLYAWLESAYGYQLIARHTYGSVVPEIDKEMLASVPVPLVGEQERAFIGAPVLEAKRKWDQAWQLEQTAIAEVEASTDV